jgi:hypothetical protein
MVATVTELSVARVMPAAQVLTTEEVVPLVDSIDFFSMAV